MANKIRVAVVGLGFGAEFLPIYQRHPDTELYAICQRSAEKLNEVGDQFGIAQRYSSYEALLPDPNVDAIHVNTPIAAHAPMSLAALNAGKHTACTVPMATTVEECLQLVDSLTFIGKPGRAVWVRLTVGVAFVAALPFLIGRFGLIGAGAGLAAAAGALALGMLWFILRENGNRRAGTPVGPPENLEGDV